MKGLLEYSWMDPTAHIWFRGSGIGTKNLHFHPNSKGGLTPFSPLSGLQEIPVATREEREVLCFPSRGRLKPKQKQYPAVDVTGDRSKSDAVKSNIA